jgi:transcriptional regulator with XRE-family HTH domain
MPRISRLKLPPLDYGKETIGQRITRVRKERGFSQVELAKRIGIIQSLVSTYEKDKLRMSAEMAVRFALALGVGVEELLSPKNGPQPIRKPNRKLLRRMEKIEKLPPRKQEFVLQALDSLLKAQAI